MQGFRAKFRVKGLRVRRFKFRVQRFMVKGFGDLDCGISNSGDWTLLIRRS